MPDSLSSAVLDVRVSTPQDLSAHDRAQMLALLSESFENVSPEQFGHDVDEKDTIILVRDATHRIRGFTSLLSLSMNHAGQEIEAVYTGDTVVDPPVRAARPLHRAFVQLLWNRFQELQTEHFYWLDAVLTFQGYRVKRMFREFVPAASDDWLVSVRNALAARKFGDRFDPNTGTVSFAHPIWLRPSEMAQDEAAAQDPAVAQFARYNPRYRSGIGLVCLARLALENVNQEAIDLI